MTVGERIKQIADENGVSIKRLADIAGVPYSTIYFSVKRNSIKIDPEIMKKIERCSVSSPLERNLRNTDPDLAVKIASAVIEGFLATQSMIFAIRAIENYETSDNKEFLSLAKEILEQNANIEKTVGELAKYL